jgi:hypothetical protein
MASAFAQKLSVVVFSIFLSAAPVEGHVAIDGSFRPEFRKDLQTVANEVWTIVRDLFGQAPPLDLPIRCYFKPDYPMTSLDNWFRPAVILVGVNITQSQWDQFSYQLGHELGHIMMNPRRSNGIIETLCMALAYEVLDRLYEKWGSGSPYANRLLTAYSHNFRSYREQDEHLALSRLPPEITLAVGRKDWIFLRKYFEDHRSEQEQLTQIEIQSQHGRDIQTLGAMALRSGPIAWKSLWNIGFCTESSPDMNAVSLNSPIKPECIRRLSSIFCRIGRGCDSAAER